jgi:soluble lytic murein transglycosylase-like protein
MKTLMTLFLVVTTLGAVAKPTYPSKVTIEKVQRETGWGRNYTVRFLHYTKSYSVDPSLALAVARVESRFDPKAIHKNNNGSVDYGAFQVNSSNRKWLKRDLQITDLKSPRQNLKAGVYMLSKSLGSTRNTPHGILVYHRGSRVANRLASRGMCARNGYYLRIATEKQKIRSRWNGKANP